jgi:hypothetical protein
VSSPAPSASRSGAARPLTREDAVRGSIVMPVISGAVVS